MTENNKKKMAVFTCMGASNHTNHDRADNDYYATEPKAMELLLEVEKFSHRIWEPACGEGHLSKVLEKHGYEVISTDLVYRGFGQTESVDFLKLNKDANCFDGDIITNPPYKYAQAFVEKALDLVNDGQKVAMFLRLVFLETKARKRLFTAHPPKVVYVSSSRLNCAFMGDFSKNGGGAMAYAWFVWQKGYKGDTIVKWIN